MRTKDHRKNGTRFPPISLSRRTTATLPDGLAARQALGRCHHRVCSAVTTSQTPASRAIRKRCAGSRGSLLTGGARDRVGCGTVGFVTTPRKPDDPLTAFYASGARESRRLLRANSRLEFVRTRDLLRARLPGPPARVLDVGGGTGVHAAWLAQDGYDVVLVDVVEEHVRVAQQLSATLEARFDARVGDARSLPAQSGTVDACLLLGPLYHLPDRLQRLAALVEAVRVTRSGGLVCAAAISRYAWPLYALRDAGALPAEQAQAVAATIDSGYGDPVGALPDAFSHRPHDLAEELHDAGLLRIEIVGIEGPAWPMFTRHVADERADALLDGALQTARLCDGQPDMIAASAHLLGCGLRP